jgi:transketolase
MKHDPKRPDWSERDRFIMGKGHATPVYYAVLADSGYFPMADLEGFRRPGSFLQGHPKQYSHKGIEASTGTLGLGLSTAVGMAFAAKLKNEQQTYYCLCGDGEIQEGQIWEAAMYANKYKLNNLIAFIDRNYMQSDGYSEDVMPMDPVEPKWEAFGWETYSIDGHNIALIIDTIEKAKKSDKPVMIVCKTIKGKGVSFMENDNTWHGTPPSVEIASKALKELATAHNEIVINPVIPSAPSGGNGAEQTKKGFADGLIALGDLLPNVVVIDTDVAKATRSADFQKKYPERHFNAGVSEQNMLSVAAGMSIEGYIPFATSFGMFITTRACDQLRNSICYPKANVKIAATHCGISTGGDGASHQINEDLAICRAMPNLTVLVPGDYEEAKQATIAAAYYDGPVYIRYGRDTYPIVPEIHGKFEIGKSKLLMQGSDLTIFTTGIMVSEGMKASDELRKYNIHARVIHLPTIKPLDEAVIIQAAKETKFLVTVEEHSIIGGLGEAVAGVTAATLPTQVYRIGVMDEFGQSGQSQELLDLYGLRAVNIVKKVLDIIKA